MDLIDRAEVLYKFVEILPDPYSLDWYKQAKPEEVKDLVDELYSIVLNVNRIDAQPVKHGHWIIEEEKIAYGKYKQIWALRCSECRKDPIKHIGGGLSNWWFQTPEFCPVCGSDNRGDSDADS